jgi:hygromycin-B 7''-O-kinase
MHALPCLTDYESFRAWRADASRCLAAALDIARSHGLPHGDPQLFATGTNLVVALDDGLILKIFPPMLRHQFRSEQISLTALHRRVSVPIPEIVLEGERDQWPYLVITRLHGVIGTQAWPILPEDQKERILGQIGETIASVQRVPVGACSRLEPRWDEFIPRQIEGCRARHERLGLPGKFLDRLDDFLSDAAELIPLDAPPVILTGEFTPENFLLNCQGDQWRLSGLIDFGDVMTGWGEYDLLGPSAFLTAGMPRRVRSLFEGFGYLPAEMDYTLKRRLMALALLHRFSNLNRQICIEGWQQKADDLAQLQDLLWPNSPSQ